MTSKRRRRKEYPLLEVTDFVSGKPEVFPKSHYEMCCDCGLVHSIKIKKHKTDQHKIVIIATREDELTAKYRKKHGIKIVKEDE